jgi:LCP family protein required for cell wall assembly
MDTFDLAGLAIQPQFLIGLFIANLLLLVYRAWAIVDAWTIARALGGQGVSRGAGRQAGIVSVAGLAAVLLVMSGAHVGVARFNLLAASTAACIFDPAADCGDDPTSSRAPGESPGPSGEPTPAASLGPDVSADPIPHWDGKERLNILLVGVDEQEGGFNTDTMITVSIDPATNQVVMFQLPRDTVDVPLPPGPVRNWYGAVYPGKINSFAANGNRNDWFPGGKKDHVAGLNGLKAVLGHLYGLDIKYYVKVNFDGFREIVDALGGVTINVQVPVLDDNYPQPGGRRLRLFIPAGIQHMTGAEALQYARSRKSTSDFERAARQQRVIVSVRQQLDIGQALRNIDVLATAIGNSLKTDIPRAIVPQLLGLADEIGSRSIRSVTFTPPFYQVECLSCPPRGYIIQPRVDRIRAAVSEAFNIDPNFAEARDALLAEAAEVWVLNGTGRQGEAGRISEYLSYLGIAASAPNQDPDVSGPNTTIRAYNGAEESLPLTAEALKLVFGVELTLLTDPAVNQDFVVITGAATPQLTPPPAP